MTMRTEIILNNVILDSRFCIDFNANPSGIAKNGMKSTNTLEEKLPPYHQFHHDERM